MPKAIYRQEYETSFFVGVVNTKDTINFWSTLVIGYWNNLTGKNIRETKLFLTQKSYVVCNLFIIYSLKRDH